MKSVSIKLENIFEAVACFNEINIRLEESRCNLKTKDCGNRKFKLEH